MLQGNDRIKVTAENIAHFKVLKLDALSINDEIEWRSIKTAYKQCSLHAHPDKRGNSDAFHALTNALEQIENIATSPFKERKMPSFSSEIFKREVATFLKIDVHLDKLIAAATHGIAEHESKIEAINQEIAHIKQYPSGRSYEKVFNLEGQKVSLYMNLIPLKVECFFLVGVSFFTKTGVIFTANKHEDRKQAFFCNMKLLGSILNACCAVLVSLLGVGKKRLMKGLFFQAETQGLDRTPNESSHDGIRAPS
jgi:hypothetical protein